MGLNMSNITKQTLSLAIFSMVINRCRLLATIDRVSLEVDNEEHLSETILDMDKALGELADLYDAARRVEGGGYDFNLLYANAEEEYKQDCAERSDGAGKA